MKINVIYNFTKYKVIDSIQIDFFEGLYFSKKLNIKIFKIKTRKIKSLMKRKFPQEQREGLAGARLPRHLDCILF